MVRIFGALKMFAGGDLLSQLLILEVSFVSEGSLGRFRVCLHTATKKILGDTNWWRLPLRSSPQQHGTPSAVPYMRVRGYGS